MRRLAVVGGGITGLSAALRAAELSAASDSPVEVLLYEESAVVGGCIRTVREDGMILELGPDSLLVEKPAAAGLLRTLNLEQDVIDIRPGYKRAAIVHDGRLRPIPTGFRLFSPTSIPALVRGGLFSPWGIARAAIEPFVPVRRESTDESVSSFVRRRFGREILERLAQPITGGIYSGDPDRLSMRATVPQFVELERRYGSVLRGMQSAPAAASAPRLAGLRGGTGSIIDALRSRLREHVRTSTRVSRLQRERGGWSIRFEDGTSVFSDGVICTVPAYCAAKLIAAEDAPLAQLLDGIRYNSIATVNMVYEANALSGVPAVSGFVVPFIERRRLVAATFTTQKYTDRAPAGTAIVRAFLGGALAPQLLELTESELAEAAAREIADLAGIRNAPGRSIVTKWMRLLPEYAVGHLERVQEINTRASRLGGFWLAGAAYGGVGIPDCVSGGQTAAESAFSTFRSEL